MPSEPYVRIEMHKGKAVVCVMTGDEDGETHKKRYPLTKAGCLEAGAAIYAMGAESWMCSSSVDFPQEAKPGFRLDVRELMSEGFRKALEEFDRPRKELVGKIMEWCSKKDFQATLTPKEQVLFDVMKKKVANGGG